MSARLGTLGIVPEGQSLPKASLLHPYRCGNQGVDHESKGEKKTDKSAHSQVAIGSKILN